MRDTHSTLFYTFLEILHCNVYINVHCKKSLLNKRVSFLFLHLCVSDHMSRKRSRMMVVFWGGKGGRVHTPLGE